MKNFMMMEKMRNANFAEKAIYIILIIIYNVYKHANLFK